MPQCLVRPKPPEEKKVSKTFSLAPDTFAALVIAAKKDRRTPSAFLENLIRDTLGLTSQNTPDPEEKA